MSDYINRYAVLNVINDAIANNALSYESCVNEIIEFIAKIPSADVQPVRHGRWNEESPDCLDGDSVYVCSACGETWTLIEGTPLDNNMHYCPNCGAKMDGGKT